MYCDQCVTLNLFKGHFVIMTDLTFICVAFLCKYIVDYVDIHICTFYPLLQSLCGGLYILHFSLPCLVKITVLSSTVPRVLGKSGYQHSWYIRWECSCCISSMNCLQRTYSNCVSFGISGIDYRGLSFWYVWCCSLRKTGFGLRHSTCVVNDVESWFPVVQ